MRWPPIIFGAVSSTAPRASHNQEAHNIQMVNIISYVSLAVWDIPMGWKWTCYIICGAGFGLSGLLMA